MKIPKPSVLINRSLNYTKKYIVTLFLVSFLVSLIFSLYVSFDRTKKENEINSTITKCGDFDYIQKLVDDKELEQIKKRNDIKKYSVVALEDTKVNNRQAIMEWVVEDEIANTDIKINTGKFPSKADEVLVERWLLTWLSIPSDESIGKSIQLWNNDENCYETKIISGIITTNVTKNQEINGENGYPIIIGNSRYSNEKTLGIYNVYINLYNHKDAVSIVEKLEKKDFDASLNEELCYVRGYMDGAVFEKIFENIVFIIVLVVLMLFVCLCIKNVVDMCIHKWAGEIAIYKSIGIPIHIIRNTVMCKMSGIILIASSVGHVCGTLIVYTINVISLKTISSENDIEFMIRWPIMNQVVMTAIVLVVELIIVYDVFGKIQKQYFSEYVNSIDKGMTQLEKSYSTLFKSEKFAMIKLALRNFVFHKWRKITACLCITASVVVVCILNVKLATEIIPEDNNEYEFLIKYDTDTYYDETGNILNELKEVDTQVKKVLEKNNIQCEYNEYAFVNKFKYNKKYITDEFRKKLSFDVVSMMELKDNSDYITYPIVIVGYSDKMLDEMYEKKLISANTIEDGKCLFVERTINRDNTASVKVNAPIGEKYAFDSYYSKKLNVVVEGSAKDLLVYPELNYNYMAIIVNEKTFNEYYNSRAVYDFYYNSKNKTVNKEIEKILSGVWSVRYENLSYERAMEKNQKRQDYVFYVITYASLVFLMFASIIMFTYLEIDIRNKEYKLLNMLGVSGNQLKKILFIEICITFVFGCAIGNLLAIFLVEYLHNNMILIGTAISSSVYMSGLGCIGGCIALINYLAGKKINVDIVCYNGNETMNGI